MGDSEACSLHPALFRCGDRLLTTVNYDTVVGTERTDLSRLDDGGEPISGTWCDIDNLDGRDVHLRLESTHLPVR